MSNKYKKSSEVPTEVICNRLHELSHAITEGKAVSDREFTMRIPAEVDRDADLILCEAAKRISQLQGELGRYKELISSIYRSENSEEIHNKIDSFKETPNES